MPEVDCTLEYRDVVDFPGYKVGDDGSVWSCWEQVHLGWRYGSHYRLGTVWHRLQPGPGARGHQIITLCPGRHTRMVHRLVLEAFVGPRPKGMQCRHFPDRNPANNALSNLQWGTPGENQADRIVHGTDMRGEKHPLHKLTVKEVLALRADHAAGGVNYTTLGRKYKISKGNARLIVLRKIWTHV